MFAEFLTERTHDGMVRAGRKTIQYVDVSNAVETNDSFDFLHEVIPAKKQRRILPSLASQSTNRSKDSK